MPACSLRPADVWCVMVLLLLSAVLFFFRWQAAQENGTPLSVSAAVIVSIDGGAEAFCVPLSKNASYRIESQGYHFTVVVEAGRVSVTSADCLDGICARTPAISSDTGSIVCVPAQLMIQIQTETSQDADYVVY